MVARRTLGGMAVALGLAALIVLATGGFTVGRVAVTRAEDLVAVLAVVLAVRALLVPEGARPSGAGITVRAAPWVVMASVCVYIALMGFVVVTRHLTFKTHALDLGYYVQVMWQLARGQAPYVTLPPMHAWGDHLSPVLYLFAPLGPAMSGAIPLLVAQTVILAAGAVVVFAYARRRLGAVGGGAAAAFAALYLMNPSLHGMNVRDVHPAAFALPFLLAAALAFDARRYGLGALALVLTLATREDAAVAVVGFAIWLAAARGQWGTGAAIAALGVLILAVDIAWLMPWFRGSPYPHLHRYTHLGASFADILLTLAIRPWRWLAVVVTGRKIWYILELLAPLGLLPLLAPWTLMAALPGLAMNVLSRDPVLYNYRSQYQAFVLPFLILAAVEGYRRLRPEAAAGPPGARRGASRMLGMAFLFSGVLSARTVNELTVTRWWVGEDVRRVHGLVQRVPDGVAASVNERMVPHLAGRPEIYVFPSRGASPPEYVLELDSVLAKTPAERFDRASYREIGREGAWVLLARS